MSLSALSPSALLAKVPVCPVLGVRVSALTAAQFYELVRASVRTRQRVVVANHNLHSVVLFHHDPLMRTFFTRMADAAGIDGMPLVFWGRLMGLPLRPEHRFTAVDWLPSLLRLGAEEGWRVYFLGSRPDVAERSIEVVQKRFGGLHYTARHGYFDADDVAVNRALVEAINAWAPDVLIVGMGMPRQEHWLAAHLAELNLPCALTAGAAVDYLVGAVRKPPRFMGRLGLEWLARLAVEPRRLGYRYLVEPWGLLPRLAADVRARARGELRCFPAHPLHEQRS